MSSLKKFVAPDGDRLKGQRAFAQPRDHRVAPGLDPLGDGDLALARQKFDRAHLAQIHAHRVVGAVERLRARLADRDLARGRGLDDLGGRLGLFVGLFLSSMTLMPISESIDITSSICSEETCSGGSTC
jgi:hypothetical protein